MSRSVSQFLIYGLIDPTTHLIRYVGLSSSGLRRPREHRRPSCPNSHCRHWVRQLQNVGLDYDIAVLEVVSNQGELPAAERWWIAYGRACGWPLTNLTAGGAPSTETLLKLRQLQIARDTAASAYMRAWYSAEDIEACRQRLGIPSEIEKRCLQFFDQHFTYKHRHVIVDDAMTPLRGFASRAKPPHKSTQSGST